MISDFGDNDEYRKTRYHNGLNQSFVLGNHTFRIGPQCSLYMEKLKPVGDFCVAKPCRKKSLVLVN